MHGPKLPKDFNSLFLYQDKEEKYPFYFSCKRIYNFLTLLPENAKYNIFVCWFILSATLCGLLMQGIESPILIFFLLDAFYIVQLFVSLLHEFHRKQLGENIPFPNLAHFLDAILCFNQVWRLIIQKLSKDSKIPICSTPILYGLRLHRAFGYLCNMNNYYLVGSVLGSLTKYIYYAFTLKIIFSTVLIIIGHITFSQDIRSVLFYAFYSTFKLVLPIGPDTPPTNDISRLWFMTVMLIGCLVIMGIAVASLTLIIGLYLRPEDTFRKRFQLIKEDMAATNIPKPLRVKVETFYRMFWNKQKAVAKAHLLHTYPPCLVSDVNSNIYFRAQLSSRLLYDLSNHFLAEVAKYMETIHYIPGELIIKRNTSKSSLVFIAYGDVERELVQNEETRSVDESLLDTTLNMERGEMSQILSAEDDETPILRLTRGSIKNPCGITPELACIKARTAVRAATFCTAHVLKATDMWRVCAKYGKRNMETQKIRAALQQYLKRVKAHYATKPSEEFKHKSNIIPLKRSLIDLKEAQDANGEPFLKNTTYVLKLARCYIMRNLTHSATRMESDPMCLKNTFPCILQPNSNLLVVWNSFIAVITLLVAVIHPYNLIYLKSISYDFTFFNYVVSVIYIVDVIVHLSTGTKVEEGVSLTLTETSSYQSHSIWFALHLLSALPIFEFIGDGSLAGLNKLCKVPVVFRMLKALEDDCVYHSNVMRFFSYFVLVTVLTYFMAALKQGFVCFGFNYCIVSNLTDAPHWTNSSLDEETVDNRVTFSIYWAISILTFTTHKAAIFSNKAVVFKLFVLFVLEFCLIIHLMIESTYSATIMVSETMREGYQACINSVTRFFDNSNVDPVLRNRFIKYLNLCWLTDKAYGISNANQSILFDLPKHVHQDILTLQRSKYLLSMQFAKFLSNELLKNIASQARLFYVSPNEILLHTGQMTNEIYIIKQGVCEILDPETRLRKGLLEAKACFGNLECLLRKPAYYTIRAVTHVRVYTISRKYLREAIELPRIKDAIYYVKQLPEYEALTVKREPFVKYEDPPPAPNRQYFPLPRKFQSDYGFMNPFQKLRFFSVLRYVFPRFTIRPDGLYLKRYEWFRATCAIAAALVYPLYTYFILQWPWLVYFSWMLDICAYVDLLQRMLIGYFDPNGILVYHPAATAVHYLKGAFLVDFFSCMPLEHLDYVRTTIYFKDNAYMQPSTIQFFMYNRVVQIYRVPGALTILDEYIERKDYILMIKAFPLIISLLAVVTSQMLEWSVEKWSPVGGGWRFVLINGNNSWIIRNSHFVRYNITKTPFHLVLTTFYWAVYETTSTGFNIFQAGNTSLLTVIIIGMLLGTMLITYYSVRVISIRCNVNQALATFQENMKDIVVFMQKENLGRRLEREVVSYYEYTWKKTGGTTNRSVLKLCEQITLRTDAILQIYGSTFNKCPILYKCDLSLLRAVGRALNTMYLTNKMTIIGRGDVISRMYIVDHGSVIVEEPDHLTKLRRGSVFGNLENVGSVLSAHKFITTTDTQLLTISSELFYGILQDYPTSKTLMENLCVHNKGYIKSALDYESIILSNESLRGKSVRRRILSLLIQSRKCILIYFILVSLLSVYGDFYNACFHSNNKILIFFLYLLDVLFCVKIAKEYFLSHFARDLQYSHKPGYFKNEFWYDLFSLLPIEVLCFLSSKPMKIFPYLRLNRAIRVTTVRRSLKNYQERLYINLTITTITSVFIWFSLFVHICTCIWYLLGTIEESYQKKSSWRYTEDGISQCNNRYLCSLYFIMTTFSQNGVGDILPGQPSEVAFVCILMILTTIIFMIYVGEFSNIIQYQSFRFYTFFANYLELKEFLKNNRVSKNLVHNVKKYTVSLFRSSRGVQFPYFLEKAPECLRLDIMSAAYIHHLESHPIFMQCEPGFLRQLVGRFQLFHYCEDMHVVREGQITNAMYFVHKGRVVEEDEYNAGKRTVFHSGECFGTENGLTQNLPFDFTYRTVSICQVLTLTFGSWKYLLKHFRNSANIIYDMDANSNAAVGLRANIRDILRPKSTATVLSQESKEAKMKFKSTTSVRFQPSVKGIEKPKEFLKDSKFTTDSEDNKLKKLVQDEQQSTEITDEMKPKQFTLPDSVKSDDAQDQAPALRLQSKTLALDEHEDNQTDQEKENLVPLMTSDTTTDTLKPLMTSDTTTDTLKPKTSDSTIFKWPLDSRKSASYIKYSHDDTHGSKVNFIIPPKLDKPQSDSTLPIDNQNLTPAENANLQKQTQEKEVDEKYAMPTTSQIEHSLDRAPSVTKQETEINNDLMKNDRPSTSMSPLESENLPPSKGMEITEVTSAFTKDIANASPDLGPTGKESEKEDTEPGTSAITDDQNQDTGLQTLQRMKEELMERISKTFSSLSDSVPSTSKDKDKDKDAPESEK